jgi:hypothetical protein
MDWEDKMVYDDLQERILGRLAFRIEGTMWNAYWAPGQHTLEGARLLGSIKVSLVSSRDGPVYDGFIQLMKKAFDSIVEEITGRTPEWSVLRDAPEHERGGTA